MHVYTCICTPSLRPYRREGKERPRPQDSPSASPATAPSSHPLRALLSVCGGCSFEGLVCCSCRVCVCRCRGVVLCRCVFVCDLLIFSPPLSLGCPRLYPFCSLLLSSFFFFYLLTFFSFVLRVPLCFWSNPPDCQARLALGLTCHDGPRLPPLGPSHADALSFMCAPRILPT